MESTDKPRSSLRGVKDCKNKGIKERLRTLILSKGMSEPQFFHSLGLTRQYWYIISWDIYPCPKDLKIKIAMALKVDSTVIWKEASNEKD